MNEKITLQDLINLFSEKQGLSKKDAELFVRTMFDLIKEALETEKYVKIKGLGTFKLTEVDSRESVNVNTGERIEIQGHTKVSFTPDTTMKELINKPFSHFETVILNEGVELADTPVDTEETMVQEEIAPEIHIAQEEPAFDAIQQAPAIEPTQKTAEEEPKAEESIVDVPATEDIPVAEEPLAEEMVVEEQTEEAVDEEENVEEVVVEETPVTDKEKQEDAIIIEPQPEIIETKEEKTAEKNTNRILWGIIVVLLLVILLGIYWMFLRPSDPPVNIPAPTIQEETIVPAPAMEKIIPEDTLKTVQFIELSAEELRQERVPSLSDTLDYQIIGTKEEYTLQKGETIIRASVKFFGTKKYWPYIVKHNMDVLPDPDNIPAGARIKIPKLVEKNK